jgi:hypothetical protein
MCNKKHAQLEMIICTTTTDIKMYAARAFCSAQSLKSSWSSPTKDKDVAPRKPTFFVHQETEKCKNLRPFSNIYEEQFLNSIIGRLSPEHNTRHKGLSGIERQNTSAP